MDASPTESGYSVKLVNRNSAANPALLGVRLGRYCIAQGISVTDVANMFGVSRQNVYNWFAGRYTPRGEVADKVQAFLASRA
jgi:DNA-binding XRE family transcriptional regulator